MMQGKAELMVAVRKVQLSHALRANTPDHNRSAKFVDCLWHGAIAEKVDEVRADSELMSFETMNKFTQKRNPTPKSLLAATRLEPGDLPSLHRALQLCAQAQIRELEWFCHDHKETIAVANLD